MAPAPLRESKSSGGAAGRADRGVPVRPAVHDHGHVGVGLDVVEQRGLAKEALLGGAGRLDPGHAALALDGLGERRALAADKGAGAAVDADVKVKAAAQDVLAEKPQLVGLLYGALQARDGTRVLGAHVDVALMGAHGVAGDDHALQQAVGVALHHALVHEGARVALVAVADHIAHGVRLTGHALPLAPGGKAAASAAAQL